VTTVRGKLFMASVEISDRSCLDDGGEGWLVAAEGSEEVMGDGDQSTRCNMRLCHTHNIKGFVVTK
jgi:hypothetical protein